jgi:hypothetical protein
VQVGASAKAVALIVSKPHGVVGGLLAHTIQTNNDRQTCLASSKEKVVRWRIRILRIVEN